MKAFSENSRASYDYHILETLEAGIELRGFEVKSVRAGRMSLRAGFVVPQGRELFLLNASIPPYQAANTPARYDPARSRRLLLKKSEIASLLGKIRERGLTAVPLKVYDKRGKIKVLVGIARGKKKYDKREAIRKREVSREMRRLIRA